MDDTYSESDVSLSPSQILERLNALRQLHLLQRGKLQKQRLQYKETSENSSSITEIVSHFSNSTSYNTFRSLLQSTNSITNEVSPRTNRSDLSGHIQEQDLVEGVSVLNLSHESEFVINSPLSINSIASASTKRQLVLNELNTSSQSNNLQQDKIPVTVSSDRSTANITSKRHIALDEVPILSPKTDFETLLLQKLQLENNPLKAEDTQTESKPQRKSVVATGKKTFLRKGEGIARYGVNDKVIIQNTKSLPWRRKSFLNKNNESPLKQQIKSLKKTGMITNNKSETQLKVPKINTVSITRKPTLDGFRNSQDNENSNCVDSWQVRDEHTTSNFSNLQPLKAIKNIEISRNKHPLITNKGKTWAAVLTKEQNDFLTQLKQSDYYKNFNSPTKSLVSEASYDETMTQVRHERENAEQNMFDLLESKVGHDSFDIENSFINRFLRRSKFENSGESTPMVLQKCLSQNPGLMHIDPCINDSTTNDKFQSDNDACCSNCSECCCDTFSTVSCCSCKTVDNTPNPDQNHSTKKGKVKKSIDKISKKVKIVEKEVDEKNNQDVTVTENDIMKANMAEMNAKLVATSEMLKERLRELEDEIEVFRKENANLSKLRDEIDQERHKFYEEKATFEQKFNEEKVLAEYYLAEEKEKLSKQKQMYEKYVREMRGRLNKKDKDEVVNLKKEINDLKEEIRIKDAKSTSTIARLRNQIKIIEKEKKDLNEEIEKLKKQNKRIQHSNEVTRRLTNLKYLEQINKKLNNISSKDSRSEVEVDSDVKYKAYEIERQSRIRKPHTVNKEGLRPLPRAKSVPNLNVTSRYAKYFSQRDTISQINPKIFNLEVLNHSEDGHIDEHDDTISNESLNDGSNEDNYLERVYMERFKPNSPQSNRSSGSNSNFENYVDKPQLNDNSKDFFIQKSNPNSARNSKSPGSMISLNCNSEVNQNRSKSPVSILNTKSSSKSPSLSAYLSNQSGSNTSHKSKSPTSAFNHSSLRSATVILNHQYDDKEITVSPEPSASHSTQSKTNLNPMEIKKPDGSRELRFPNGNVKHISADGKYTRFVYYNGDIKENFYNDGRIKYFYAETKTYHTTHADGLEILEFPDGQVENRYRDGSTEIRLANGSIRYFDPKNEHVREEWRFPDGASLTVSANGERRIVFSNGQIEVHANDHKRREFPDGTIKLVYNDGTSETRYASGRVRIKDKQGNLIMDSAPG